MADIAFWFDPVCPFAWMTSKWVRLVAEQREYDVEWRLISLRLLNSHIDYDAHFPPGYEEGHSAGLRMLRVAARTRAEHGSEALDALQEAFGAHIWDIDPPADPMAHERWLGTPDHVAPILDRAGLPADLLEALDDDAWDAVIQEETDLALSLTGKDVGTPIIQFEPPDGVAFFGPVISRLPAPDTAVELWDHVIGLARYAGFSEMKRSLRERPQLRVWGHTDDAGAGAQEDWHGGSRRQKR